ncbi:MAG: holo-ACP synthase [Defluviitaleaceae bacterium]|nr:holo-ACP synthase [Defluviitaleaceae bacterium]
MKRRKCRRKAAREVISGVGVDIVKIARFEDCVEKEKSPFMRRVFTEREREYIKSAQNAAGIFAAKEAVVKALGTGFRKISPQDVEILHEESGKPYVIFGGATVHISISHTDTDAIAFAVYRAI